MEQARGVVFDISIDIFQKAVDLFPERDRWYHIAYLHSFNPRCFFWAIRAGDDLYLDT